MTNSLLLCSQNCFSSIKKVLTSLWYISSVFCFLWHTLFTFLLVSFVIPNNALNLIIIKNHEILILFYSLPLYCAIFFIENASLVLNDLNIFLLGFSVKVGSFLVCLEALHRNYVYLLPPSPFLVCLFVLSFYCYFF